MYAQPPPSAKLWYYRQLTNLGRVGIKWIEGVYHLHKSAGDWLSYSCLWSRLLWIEISRKGFPKKFCERSPLRWPPYPLIGRTSFLSSFSQEKRRLNPSESFMKFWSSVILVSSKRGFTSTCLKMEDSTGVGPLLNNYCSVAKESLLDLGVLATVRNKLFL